MNYCNFINQDDVWIYHNNNIRYKIVNRELVWNPGYKVQKKHVVRFFLLPNKVKWITVGYYKNIKQGLTDATRFLNSN